MELRKGDTITFRVTENRLTDFGVPYTGTVTKTYPYGFAFEIEGKESSVLYNNIDVLQVGAEDIKRFYFTYGSDGHPYEGGWTEVRAKDMKDACRAFRSYHPDQELGLLNCAGVYPEAIFKHSSMAEEGNRGAKCHEIITLSRVEITKKEEQ